MIQIDVNDMKETVYNLNGVPPFNGIMTFFYDESGNCRKFSLTREGVNSEDSLIGDFVLAGVAFDGTEPQTDFSGLYKALDYKEGQKELKFRHLYCNSKDFESFIDSKRATEFLQWLDESNLYIHYSALNNLYYSLVDIVDSLWDEFPQCIIFIQEIKSALYDFTLEYRDKILDMLFRYNYPNVTKCKDFCDELCDYLYSYNNDDEYYPGFFLELLRQMLKAAGKKEELIFVQNNEPYILINEYYLFYLERCQLFSKSHHYFDEESTVERKLSEIELYDGNELLYNYSFIKSHENVYIQISDMVAGLLRKLFMYLDSHDNDGIVQISTALNHTSVNNYRRIWDMIGRSDEKCQLLIKNSNSSKNIQDRMNKLSILAHINEDATKGRVER